MMMMMKFKGSQASKARLQSSKHTGAKQKFNAKWPIKVIQGHVLWSLWKRDQGLLMLALFAKLPTV